MTVSLLIDNDVVIKLSRMDVYVDAMSSLAQGPGTVGSLKAMLHYMGITNEKFRTRLTGSKAEADRLNEALHSIVEIEMTDAEAAMSAAVMKIALLNDLDLQEGELALIVVAVSRGALDIATGDKRALRELPTLERHWPSASTLRARWICLEQIFKRLCTDKGFPRVRVAVQTSPRSDETITFVHERTAASGTAGFLAGLDLVVGEHIERPAPGWLKAI